MPHQPFPKGNTIGRPFAKGKSGNPGGRPSIVAIVEAATGKSVSESSADVLGMLYRKALEGDIKAAELYLVRALGKPKESIDLNLGGPSQEQTQQILDALRMTPQQRRDALDAHDTTEHAEPVGD